MNINVDMSNFEKSLYIFHHSVGLRVVLSVAIDWLYHWYG